MSIGLQLGIPRNVPQITKPRSADDQSTQVLSKDLDGSIGPARLDAAGRAIRWATQPYRPSCYQWIVAGAKRWCSVTGLPDTMGREIGPDSYVACRIERAPKEGWR